MVNERAGRKKKSAQRLIRYFNFVSVDRENMCKILHFTRWNYESVVHSFIKLASDEK